VSDPLTPNETSPTTDTAAAIDIGSNSIKMTIAQPTAGGGLDELAWVSETVRLGAGLDASGRLADDRIEAALAALDRFARQAHAHGATRVVAVATEATRAAANGAEFLERIGRETGIVVRVIDGDEEAALTFRGLAASTDVSGEVVVADIGGGSTELIAASGGVVRAARSLPLGSGRLTDRLLPTDPPTAAALAACRDAATAVVAPVRDELRLPLGSTLRLIVVGGTGEYLARLVPDERRITVAELENILEELQRVPSAALAAQLAIPEARARVLPAGAAIVAALGDLLRPGRIEVARSGIRAGLLLDLFASKI
jgi:exopolyphosphatase/guanosine-5'-triphosphate,3'-diphosphate pyrophosphatase